MERIGQGAGDPLRNSELVASGIGDAGRYGGVVLLSLVLAAALGCSDGGTPPDTQATLDSSLDVGDSVGDKGADAGAETLDATVADATDVAELGTPDDLPGADSPGADMPLEVADLGEWDFVCEQCTDLHDSDSNWEIVGDVGTDTDTLDAYEPPEGFGALGGQCGVITYDLLAAPAPFLVVNRIDFGNDPYDDADLDLLSAGGQTIMTTENAGGSSEHSEAFSFEVLHRCEGAELLKTEMEITYSDSQGKRTDILVSMHSLKVGVSVTRAMAWPLDAPYPTSQAASLLQKKLDGISAANINVAGDDIWQKHILHVLAYGDAHAESIVEAWEQMDQATVGQTVLVVTITDGDDAFIY